MSLDEEMLRGNEYESVSKGFEGYTDVRSMGISNVRGVFSACLSYDWAMFDGSTYGFVILWWLPWCAAARESNGG